MNEWTSEIAQNKIYGLVVYLGFYEMKHDKSWSANQWTLVLTSCEEKL